MSNGTIPITIKTLHGRFEFHVQRFIDRANPTSLDRTYFDWTDQFQEGYISDRLKEFSAYYSNRLSYNEVAELIERVTGNRQLSDQKIWQIVVDKASAVSRTQQEEIEEFVSDEASFVLDIQEKVAIYDPQSPEILLFEDAIQVRGQKDNREHKQGVEQKARPEDAQQKKTPAIRTDLVIWQKRDREFEYLTALIDGRGNEIISLPDLLKSRLVRDYGQESKPLPVVAITDGASVIRQHFDAVFGGPPTIILDWYHLGKKVRDLMSMIALSKDDKQEHLKFIFHHLWYGHLYTVLNYLKTAVHPKNEEKLFELIGYLEKHQTEIIDYHRRKKAGKTIGSGLMEKGCDQVIGHRQKKKGMSWRAVGSKSLAILKVVELNNQWEKLWFPQEAANDSINLQLASNS